MMFGCYIIVSILYACYRYSHLLSVAEYQSTIPTGDLEFYEFDNKLFTKMNYIMLPSIPLVLLLILLKVEF